MRLRRGTLEGPILASLPAVSSPAEFRFVCESNQLQVSINGAAYVPISGGGGASPWQQVGTAVSLVDPAVTSVAAAIAGQGGLNRQFQIIQNRTAPYVGGDIQIAQTLDLRGDAADASVFVAGTEFLWTSNGSPLQPVAIFLNGIVGETMGGILADGMPLTIETTADQVRGTTSPLIVLLSPGVAGVVNPGSGFAISAGAGAPVAGGVGGGGALATGAAGAGSGEDGGDLLISLGAGDGGGRAGLLSVGPIEAIRPDSGGADVYTDKLAAAARFGGVFLEGGAISVVTNAGAYAIVTGAWTDGLGSIGDVSNSPGTPRIRLGAVDGIWKVDWGVSVVAVDGDDYTFAADFDFLTETRGSATATIAAGDAASLSGTTTFAAFGNNEDIRIAAQSVAGGEVTLTAGYLIARRIA